MPLDYDRWREDVALALELLAQSAVGDSGAGLALPSIEAACLGPLQVWVHGAPVLGMDPRKAGGQKVQVTLASLIDAADHRVQRSLLLQRIWGPDGSPRSLSRAISSLRALLDAQEGAGALLRCRNGTCALLPGSVRTDAVLFEELYRIFSDLEQVAGYEAAAPLAVRAAAFYRGPYLADVYPVWDELLHRRDRFQRMFLHLVTMIAGHAFARSNFHACLRWCERGLREHPGEASLAELALRACGVLGAFPLMDRLAQAYLHGAGRSPHSLSHDPVLSLYEQARYVRVLGGSDERWSAS